MGAGGQVMGLLGVGQGKYECPKSFREYHDMWLSKQHCLSLGSTSRHIDHVYNQGSQGTQASSQGIRP